MARTSKLGEGLEDRKDRSAIRARVRRDDVRGIRRDLSQTFPYEHNNAKSRADSIALANAWVTEQQRAMRFDRVPVGERLQDQTLGVWVARYIQEAELGMRELKAAAHAKEEGRSREPFVRVSDHARKKGIVAELSVLRGWHAEFPRLMARRPHEVTRHHLEDVVEHLRHHRVDHNGAPLLLKPVTIKRWLQVLSAVYNTGANDKTWGFTDVLNPIRGMPMPKAACQEEQEREGRVVTEEELTTILAMIPDATLTTRCCIKFLRWSGARRSEALKLDWADVDFEVEIPTATFRDTKDPKGRLRSRTIPLDPFAVAALHELLQGKPKPLRGRIFPIGKDTPTHAWMRGRDRAGLDVRLHDMRHTRTTEITADLPAIEAQAITGHKDIRMLMRYYHASPQQLGKKLLDAQLAKAKKEKDSHAPPLTVEEEGLMKIIQALGPERLQSVIAKLNMG